MCHFYSLKPLHDTLLKAVRQCRCSIILISLAVSEMTEHRKPADMLASDVAWWFLQCCKVNEHSSVQYFLVFESSHGSGFLIELCR